MELLLLDTQDALRGLAQHEKLDSLRQRHDTQDRLRTLIDAAAELGDLCARGAQSRAVVRSAGGVPPLIELLSSSDSDTLAVACHDISEFVKYHPEGRRLMTEFGAKQPAMGIRKHSDPEVQKYALTCVQRLMVINWEYLGSK